MKKKVLLTLLTVTAVLSMVGCGSTNEDKVKSNNSADTVAFAKDMASHYATNYIREYDDKNFYDEMKEALHNISDSTKDFSDANKKGYM